MLPVFFVGTKRSNILNSVCRSWMKLGDLR